MTTGQDAGSEAGRPGSDGQSGPHGQSEASESAVEACRVAVTRLRSAGVPTEALADYVPPRRALLRTRPATMRARGEVWRLGSLLLGTDGRLYAAGRATRSAERGRPGYQSVSVEERREIAAAALRGGYPIGTPVNYDATELPLPITAETTPLDAHGPVGVHAGVLRVRWRPGAPLDGAPTLDQYLSERVDLLVHPPLGAD